MKNPQRLCAVFAAIFVLSLAACNPDPEPLPVELLSLPEITISPNINVTAGMPLSPNIEFITGMSYQWNKDGEAIPDASGTTDHYTNTIRYTPTSSGSYSITVNKDGYTGTTSNVVIVKDTVPNSLDILQDDLLTLSGDSAEAPATVKLERTLISTDNYAPANSTRWRSIYNILSAAEKYIILDLSECSFTNSRIIGNTIYQSNDINIMKDSVYIKGIILPEGISIGSSAFSGCIGLTSVTIPEGVTSIGYQAFSDCTGLTSITIPGSVTSIEVNTFANCTGLTSVIISEGVTSIEMEAFFDCTSLTSIAIPGSVTSIDTSTGYYPSGLSTIPGLTDITVDPANAIYSSKDGILYNKAKSSLLYYPKGKGGAVIIPESVTSIESSVFAHCTGLTNITIPEGVTSIGSFNGCTGLTNITIPSSVISIEDLSFRGCTGLTSVIISEGVTSIGMQAFNGCTGITSITIPKSITFIGSNAFNGCTGLVSVTFEGNGISMDYTPFPYYNTSIGSNTLKYLYARDGAGTYMRSPEAEADDWTKQL